MKLKDLFESTEKSVADLGLEFTHGAFDIRNSGLTSLAGSPVKIQNTFRASRNKLTSLIGGPSEVYGSYMCDQNKLTSLEGAPKKVGGHFVCDHNDLESLKYAPEETGRDFDCKFNGLTSLEGAPRKIGRHFSCEMNKLTSLKDVHKIFDEVNGIFDARDNPIKSHVLGLLLIKGITAIEISNLQVQDILNEHLEKGRAGMLMAQEELIELGYEEFAQL